MRTVGQFVVGFSIQGIIILQSNGYNAEDAVVILNQIRHSYEANTAVSYKMETLRSTRFENIPGQPTRERTYSTFHRNRDLVDYSFSRYRMTNDTEEFVSEIRDVWNGSEFKRLRRPNPLPDVPANLTISNDRKSIDRNLRLSREGFLLTGIPTGDDRPIYETMSSSSSLSVTEESGLINGVKCLCIHASSDHGEYDVWVDPENPSIIRRALIVRCGTNLFAGRPVADSSAKSGLPSSRTQVSFLFEDLTNQAADTDSIRKVRVLNREEFGGPRSFGEVERLITIKELDLEPKFEQSGLFDIDLKSLPDGTWVMLYETPEFPYILRNGVIMPKIDDSEREKIDSLLDTVHQPEIPLSEDHPLRGDVNLQGEASRSHNESSERFFNEVVVRFGTIVLAIIVIITSVYVTKKRDVI